MRFWLKFHCKKIKTNLKSRSKSTNELFQGTFLALLPTAHLFGIVLVVDDFGKLKYTASLGSVDLVPSIPQVNVFTLKVEASRSGGSRMD